MITRRAAVLLAVAALAVLAGATTYLGTPPASFGWFAYSPLSDGDLAEVTGSAVLLSRPQAFAALLVAAGLVLAAGVVGFGLGRRAGQRATGRSSAHQR